MFRQSFVVVAFIALSTLSCSVATQTNREALDHKAEPKINPNTLASARFLPVLPLDQPGKPLAETPWRTLLPLSSACEIF
jgi:hypothetical protein